MDIKDIIKEEKEKIYNHNMVILLSKQDVSEYERGIVSGKIQLLNSIEIDLESNDDEDNSI